MASRLPPIFTSTRTRTRTLVGAALLVGLLTVSAAILRWMVPGIADPVWLRARIEAYGRFAPLAFILLQAAQIVFAPVPGQLIAFVGGYLFGVTHGTMYSLIGAALGSTIAFLISRRYGRTYVERAITAETLAAFDRIVARDGRFALFLVFLVPGLPDDAICFMAGITRIPLWQLVVISTVSRFPGYLLMSYAGTQFASANYAATTAILAALAAISVLVYWRKDTVIAILR